MNEYTIDELDELQSMKRKRLDCIRDKVTKVVRRVKRETLASLSLISSDLATNDKTLKPAQ